MRSSLSLWASALVGTFVMGGIACVGSSSTAPPAGAPNCNDYCTQILNNCKPADDGFNNQVYKDQATCLAICVKMTPGVVGDKTHDTLACRLGNLSNLDDVGAHPPAERHTICLESAILGCGASLCESFCTFDEKVCPGSLNPYASHADCLTTCKSFDPTFTGPFVGASGNNLQCRAYHMENAVASPTAQATHCPHTGAGQPNFGTALCNSGSPDAGADAAEDAKTD